MNLLDTGGAASRHVFTRIAHDAPRRTLEVLRSERINAATVRVALGGPALDGFSSPGPDDHVKLFVPGPDGALHGRHYTPRRVDAERGELLIDFALHGEAAAEGPLTRWARMAAPGDTIILGGPRSSVLVPPGFAWHLLVGDETALPAIARQVEALHAGVHVTSIVAVTSAAEEQPIATAAEHRPVWVHRPSAAVDDPAPLLAALERFEPTAGGDGYVFIAGEAQVVRRLRAHVVDGMGHDPRWVRASGYWRRGRADVHERVE